MKKPVIIIVAIVALLLTALSTAWAKNFYITLLFEGYKTSDIQIIDNSYDENNIEYKVIKTSSKDHEVVLAILTKNALGIWNITQSQESTEDAALTTIGWVTKGEIKRFSYKDGSTIENEWNLVYCGNNATKLIEFKTGQIPENVTVNIQQNAASYLIHVISFAESDTLNNFDVPSLLIENQCITTE